MTAIEEAYRIVLEAPKSVFEVGHMELQPDLWKRLHLEMSLWCAENDRTMLVDGGLGHPNFMFRGLFVYPAVDPA